jgi:hypothetical protein
MDGTLTSARAASPASRCRGSPVWIGDFEVADELSGKLVEEVERRSAVREAVKLERKKAQDKYEEDQRLQEEEEQGTAGGA